MKTRPGCRGAKRRCHIWAAEKQPLTGDEKVKTDKKQIMILTTGGTILSVYDPSQGSIAPGLTGEELLKPLMDAMAGVELHVSRFAQKPGPHLTPELALELAEAIQAMSGQYDGFVVIQGTDTIEEFSYMMSLILPAGVPVAFTGAMKSNNEYYADGLGNIASAVSVVCAESTRGRGVLVVFNEMIFSPEHVIKMHTRTTGSFQAPDTGPLGTVHHGQVHYYYSPEPPAALQPSADTRVELLKASLGSGSLLLDACIAAGVPGVVIEGLGAGNLPPAWAEAVERAGNAGIPVVIASRSPQGSVGPVYEYIGGGKQLERTGAIFAGTLSGPKARIKLMLLLGQTPPLSKDQIAAAFR